MWGRVLDYLSRFILVVACCKILSHNLRSKYLSTLHSPDIKWFLNVCIAFYSLFSMWLLGETIWYLIFMVIIVSFKAVDAPLSMKWKPGWIPLLFKSLVKDMKNLIISFSLLFFISVVRILLQSYTYITEKYLFPLIEVVGKLPHRSE